MSQMYWRYIIYIYRERINYSYTVIQLIDRVSGEESALRDKEGQWAYRLNCIQPQGLNISDFFYSQNRSTRSRVR